MPRITYVNGRYLPHRDALVHVEDRGFQFADAVYEVIAIRRGALIDEALHLERLARSLSEIKMRPPMGEAALKLVLREVVRRNRIQHGQLYLQVSRGAAPRDFAFPKAAHPTFVVTARPQRRQDPRLLEEGIGVITIPDIRWARPDIKAVGLLPNALGKQQAREAGAFEAWQVDRDGRVTEGTSTNAWIVTAEGELVTRQADRSILNGVTRRGLLQLLSGEGLRLVERPFSVAEAKAAREAFLTSTTNFVLPVVSIDGAPVANGHPGTLTLRLRALYEAYVAAQESPP
jgi:D-alanine transaminase